MRARRPRRESKLTDLDLRGGVRDSDGERYRGLGAVRSCRDRERGGEVENTVGSDA